LKYRTIVADVTTTIGGYGEDVTLWLPLAQIDNDQNPSRSDFLVFQKNPDVSGYNDLYYALATALQLQYSLIRLATQM